MTDREKLGAIMDLLTDKTVGQLVKDNQLERGTEEFAGLVTISHVFHEAYLIATS